MLTLRRMPVATPDIRKLARIAYRPIP
jgi:hypothetical protein